MKTDKMFQATWLQCMIDVPESQILWCFGKVSAADPAYDRYDACLLKISQDTPDSLRIAAGAFCQQLADDFGLIFIFS